MGLAQSSAHNKRSNYVAQTNKHGFPWPLHQALCGKSWTGDRQTDQGAWCCPQGFKLRRSGAHGLHGIIGEDTTLIPPPSEDTTLSPHQYSRA